MRDFMADVFSNRMRRQSFLAAVLVVFLHSYSNAVANANDGSFAWWLQELVSQGFTRIAVPWFFLAFGFWLFMRFPERSNSIPEWWKGLVRKKLKSLAMPYFIWSLAGFASACILRFGSGCATWEFKVDSPQWWLSILGVYGYPLFAYHLWFLKAIFIYTLLAPILGAAICIAPFHVMIPLFLIGVFCPQMPYWISQGAFFVCLGGVFAFRYGRIPNLNVLPLTGILWAGGIFAKVLATKYGYCDIDGVVTICSLSVNTMMVCNVLGLIFFWGICDAKPTSWMDRFATTSFFVYCFHGIAIPYVGILLSRIPIANSVPALNWFLVPVLTLVLCVSLAKLLENAFPAISRVLTGGRRP